MIWFYKRGGFTLLELMIVIIIIGILASLAVPRFITATKKAKEAEARQILGTIRSSQLRYYLENNNTYATDINNLDIDLTPSNYYGYSATDGTNNIVGQATVQSGVTGIDNLQIDINGRIATFSP